MPFARFREVVKSMWSARNADSRDLPFGLVVPDCQVEFVFQNGEPWRERRGTDVGWQRLPEAFVQPSRRGCMEFTAPPGSVVLAFRVNPVVAACLLRRPLSGMWDQAISLEDALGREGGHIHEALSVLTDPRKRHALLVQWIGKRLESWNADWQRRSTVFEQLMWRHSALDLPGASRVLGTSARSLRRNLAATAGLSPKEIQIAGRLLMACALLRERPDAHVTQVAQSAGFYDHAALTHDFSERLGLTPSRFRAEPDVHFQRPPVSRLP